MSNLNRALIAGNILLVALLVWLVLSQGVHVQSSEGWEYKDLVSVLLTVVTVVLAFIGIVVAFAAIWGWQTISQGAARRAAEVAQGATDTHLQSEDFQAKLKVLVEEQVENIKRAAVQKQITPAVESEAQADPARGEERPGAIPDETWQD